MTRARAKAPTARQVAYFASLLRSSSCRWCAGVHAGACPYIAEAELDEKGKVRRVVLRREFMVDMRREIARGPEDIPESAIPDDFKEAT